MDVFEAIRTRYSCRKYLPKPVEEEKLREVLEAARLAPSARNLQEWRLVVVSDPGTRKQLAVAACNQKFIGEAAAVIACCAETDGHVMRCGEKCYPIDLAIAIDHMTLAATALGLATCWIGAFEAPAVRGILGIPDTHPLVALLALGYPAGGPPARKERHALDKVVKREKW
ncbi:MAG: nitroreductase family protein [Planctomycetota bacterium]